MSKNKKSKNNRVMESIRIVAKTYLDKKRSLCKAVANNCKRSKINKSDQDLIEIILKRNGKL